MDYMARLARVRAAMEARDVSVLFLPISSTLEYLTGIGWPIPNPTEHDRPGDWVSGMYLGQSGGPIIVEPRMGSERMVRQVEGKPWIEELRVLSEPEDYEGVMAEIVTNLRGGSGAIAVGEHAWAKSVIALRRAAPNAEIVNAHDFIWPMRMVKDEQERASMRRAATLADDAFERILPQLRLGMDAVQIKRLVDGTLFDLGADWTSFHTGIYIGSPPSSGAESALMAQDRTIERGGTIAFDFGALLDGYCSDFGRTVFIGEPSEKRRKIHDLVMRAQGAAIERMADGQITAEELDEVARSIIREAGHGPAFIHRLGHSIGKDVHEPPFLLKGDQTALREGMFFTIEPSIVTDDGAFIRVEDVVMVGETGGVNLNRTSHELHVLDL